MPPKPTGKPTITATKSSTSKTPTQKGRSKPQATKKPRSVEDQLKRLFGTLCAQLDGGHWPNAVKTCNKILRIRTDDKDALRTKLYLLLQTEQFAEALNLVDSLSKGSEHDFEKAYSFYKLNEKGKALELLQTISAQNEEHRGAMHLQAQLSYRHKDYETALEEYNHLLDTAEPNSEEYADIMTNLEAAQKHSDFIESGYLAALDTLPTTLVSGLDTAPPPQQPSTSSGILAAAAAAASTPATAPKEKKVRLKRVPKGITPGVTPPPDPERWLKKSERSTFGQGRRRKGGGGGGGATQGSSVAENVPSAGGGGSGGGKAGGGKGKKKR